MSDTPTLEVGAPFVFEGLHCTVTAIGGKNPNALTVTPDEPGPFDVRTFVIAEVEWLPTAAGFVGLDEDGEEVIYQAFGVPARANPRPHATERLGLGALKPMEG